MARQLERDFQKKLIKYLRAEFPDAIILKNDPTYLQGVPDLVVLQDGYWAALEVKRSEDEHHQPNQDYYVDLMDNMGFAAFVTPNNYIIVIEEMRAYFFDD